MRMIGSRALLAIALALLGTGCASLPDRVERVETKALSNTDASRLGTAIRQRTAAQPGRSGIHPLGVPRYAFAARVLLARAVLAQPVYAAA